MVCGCSLVRFSMFLQPLPIRFTQQILCCISKSTIKTSAKIGLKIGHPMVIGRACSVDFLHGYIGSPNGFHCWVVISIWGRSPISFEHVSLWYFALWSSPNHKQSKCRGSDYENKPLKGPFCVYQNDGLQQKFSKKMTFDSNNSRCMASGSTLKG